MSFTQAELRLLAVADRTLVKPDTRARRCRIKPKTPLPAGQRWRTKPTGRPHEWFTPSQRAEIEAMAAAGARLSHIEKALRTHRRRILYEYPTLKETNP